MLVILINQKGYKLFDPVSQNFHVSRHVIFHESVFPFSDKSLSQPDLPYYPFNIGFSDDTPISPLEFNTSEHDPIHESISDNNSDVSVSHIDPISDTNDSVHNTTDDFDSVLEPHPYTTHPTEQTHVHHQPPTRMSTRHKIQPSWMKDYHLSNSVSSSYVSSLPAISSAVLLDCPIDSTKFHFSQSK